MIDMAEIPNIVRAAHDQLTLLVHASGADLLRALRPCDEDYARVFVGTAAATAREGYEKLFSTTPKPLGNRDQSIVEVSACDATLLRADNEGSRHFPGGYRAIAHHLQPGIIWLAFRVLAPGEDQGMAYDGLVRLDDRFAWFPKPWRILPPSSGNN